MTGEARAGTAAPTSLVGGLEIGEQRREQSISPLGFGFSNQAAGGAVDSDDRRWRILLFPAFCLGCVPFEAPLRHPSGDIK